MQAAIPSRSLESSARRRRRVPVIVFGLIILLYLASVALYVAGQALQSGDWLEALEVTVWLSAFAVVGLIIAFHRPGNAIAWICLAFSAIWSLWVFHDGLLTYEAAHPGSLGSPELVAALAHPLWVPGVGLVGFLLLLFPDGRLPSRRWRVVAWLLAVTMAILTLTGFFLPGVVQDTRYVNPLGIEGLEPFDQGIPGFVLVIALVAGMLASAVSMVVRYRNASAHERMQLKWLMAAGLLAAISYALLFVWGDFKVQLIWALIPISIGLSMHRHRLYDIDRLISRTLLYTVVVAVLGSVFASAIFVLQSLAQTDDQLAVAASTLAAAALFNPVRRRTRDRIDRYFHRSRFDATRVAEVFALGVGRETDTHRIVQDWLDVVSQTVQPTTAGVWIRDV